MSWPLNQRSSGLRAIEGNIRLPERNGIGLAFKMTNLTENA